MPRYQYEVRKAPSTPVTTGVMEADSQRAVVMRLREMGYFPISVEEAGDEQQKKDVLKHALTRIKLKERNVFFRQLANLGESGMPLTRALTTIRKQTPNPKLAAIIEQLRDDIQQGSSLAEAMEQHPKVFPAMYCSLVRAGETGGMLEDVLWRIVAFGEQEEELRGKAVSAMIYPAFLTVVGSLAIFILVTFVFPKLIAIFEDFNTELPWPTVVVMSICDFMSSYWWAVILALGGLVAALVAYVRTPDGRMQMDVLLLKAPAVGDLVQKYEMAKFARTLGTLLDNGVPVLRALKITTDTLGNVAIAKEVDIIHGRVTEGDSISDGLEETEHFPPMVISMFSVGEESGRVGAVTQRLADAYDMEVDRAVKAVTALMEPILIVIMGVIIGFLVIAMLLPILNLSSVVG